MKRRFIVLLAGLAYIMPAVAQQTLFDRYAEKQGVTYVNINGEIIKTLLPDMSNISIKEINILDIDNQQLLQSIDKDLQQGRKVQTTHQNGRLRRKGLYLNERKIL